jgi:methyl-accepting chemotaxis protein
MLIRSVRAKLLGVVLTLSGVSAGLAVFGWNRMGVIDHRLADIVENAAKAEVLAAQARAELTGIQRSEKSLLLSPDAGVLGEHEKAVRAHRDRLGQLIDDIEPLSSGETLEKLTRFRGYLKEMDATTAEVVRLARGDARAEAEALSRGRGGELFERAASVMSDIEHAKEAEMLADKEAADQAYASATMMMGLFASVGIIVSGVMAVLLVNTIVRTLASVVARTQMIARGELHAEPLTVRSRDEIGRLAGAVNDMQSSLREIVTAIASNSEQVSAAATEVAATSEQMAASSDQQRAQLTQVAAAIEEMAATVTEVSGRAGEVSRQSTNAGSEASEGGDIVRRTVAEMTEIASQVESTAAAVGQLSEKAVQIGEILTVINDIADQTNLLALNAAIEAARAGEHGRGFAVVADEVRKLAERTQQATQEVSRSIGEIQTSTGDATEMMGASKARVSSGVDLARQAGHSLENIVKGSTGVAQSIDSIAAAVEEQSATSAEIARSIELISASADEANQGANQAAAAASQLSGNAESLRELVSRFRV